VMAATGAQAQPAATMLLLPASAKGTSSVISRAGLPHPRPGNDVTLP
jgi:hypothetical protein